MATPTLTVLTAGTATTPPTQPEQNPRTSQPVRSTNRQIPRQPAQQRQHRQGDQARHDRLDRRPTVRHMLTAHRPRSTRPIRTDLMPMVTVPAVPRCFGFPPGAAHHVTNMTCVR